MERKYIYIIIVLLSITLVITDYYVNRSLTSVINPNDFNANNSLSIYDEVSNTENTSTKDVTSFTITNVQDDKNIEEYKYNLRINNVKGVYNYKLGNEDGYIVFSANGEATITIKSNQVLIIYDIPLDSAYSITQSINNKYKTYIGNSETNVIDGVVTSNNNVTFNNNAINKSETKPEVENPSVKPNTNPQTNPNTIDQVSFAVILLIASLISLIIFNRLKVKRFE